MTIAPVKASPRSEPALPDPTKGPAATFDLRIEARLAAIEARLRALEPPTDARFLKALAEAFLDHVFSADDVCALAPLHVELAAVVRGLSPQQIGKRLQRLVGTPLGGFMVQRVKRTGEGVLWVMQVGEHLHADAWAGAGAGA